MQLLVAIAKRLMPAVFEIHRSRTTRSIHIHNNSNRISSFKLDEDRRRSATKVTLDMRSAIEVIGQTAEWQGAAPFREQCLELLFIFDIVVRATFMAWHVYSSKSNISRIPISNILLNSLFLMQ